MNELIIDLTALSVDELNRASEKYGPAFYTIHDAFGVVLNETCEAEKAMDEMRKARLRAWNALYTKDTASFREELVLLHHCARQAAAELVQVMAMCDKAQRPWMGE